MSKTKATIFDVASHAGVSIKTVSRVVNREPNVRAATRERVELAVTELGYRPDRSARNLARQKSNLIGLVYDDPAAYELPSSSYIIRMQQGALRACRQVQHELLIHPCDFRKQRVGAELKALINDSRLAGIVLAAPLSNMPRIVNAIEATNTPFVRLSPGKRVRNQSSVETDDRNASKNMTLHLASLGHKRIAFIAGDPEHAAVLNRVRGYEDGLRDAGLALSERLMIQGDNSFRSGEAAAERLLSRKRPPTAIFAANDDMAAGVARAARRHGIEIPGQLSVAGFDDITLARQMDPLLTTVRQPLAGMAERAVEILTAQGKAADTVQLQHECLPATLKIRESTGPAPP